MEPAGAYRLAKVRQVQRGCAAGIAFICMLLSKIQKNKNEKKGKRKKSVWGGGGGKQKIKKKKEKEKGDNK